MTSSYDMFTTCSMEWHSSFPFSFLIRVLFLLAYLSHRTHLLLSPPPSCRARARPLSLQRRWGIMALV